MKTSEKKKRDQNRIITASLHSSVVRVRLCKSRAAHTERERQREPRGDLGGSFSVAVLLFFGNRADFFLRLKTKGAGEREHRGARVSGARASERGGSPAQGSWPTSSSNSSKHCCFVLPAAPGCLERRAPKAWAQNPVWTERRGNLGQQRGCGQFTRSKVWGEGRRSKERTGQQPWRT